MRIDIDVDTSDVGAMLLRLDTCFEPEGLMRFMDDDIVPFLQRRARNRFDAGGDDASLAWVQLSSNTVARRRRGIESGEFAGISPTHPINVRTGDMEEYITQGEGEIVLGGSGDVTLHFPKRGAHRGDMRYKVGTAQGGNKNGAPPRPVLVVGQTDVNEVAMLLARRIAHWMGA